MASEESDICIDYLKKHPEEARIFVECFEDCIRTISKMIRNNSDSEEEIYNKGE